MGYNIEVSINIRNYSYISEIEDSIIYMAKQNYAKDVYKFSETDGTLKIPRYHIIFVICFENEFFKNFLLFIKYVLKKKEIHIECIYEETFGAKLIYASQYYLTTIDKEQINKYKIFRKERSYSEDESMLIDIIKNK